MSGRRLGVAGGVLVLLGVVLVGASIVLGSSPSPGGPGWFGGMMGGNHPGSDNGPQPSATGFVAGTVDAPRVIQIIAGPGYTFTPSAITVRRGETVTFAVTTMGPTVHEFMVGPAAAVAADQEGTPEVIDIGMMQTKALTYTFDGSGPYSFACHAPGHYEAGMRGTIAVVG
jgi:uncharacterized cupredoxin-like copper-binding protein